MGCIQVTLQGAVSVELWGQQQTAVDGGASGRGQLAWTFFQAVCP